MSADKRDTVHRDFGGWSFLPLQRRLERPSSCPLEAMFSRDALEIEDDWLPDEGHLGDAPDSAET